MSRNIIHSDIRIKKCKWNKKKTKAQAPKGLALRNLNSCHCKYEIKKKKTGTWEKDFNTYIRNNALSVFKKGKNKMRAHRNLLVKLTLGHTCYNYQSAKG